ncbi:MULTISPECIES: hypothetical protein [Kosmotoga]|uniref:Uncharacterized protein n=1 Tax=Kosmotoga olearia (strain ATCC BAA-1733 / DSM 21960 / TBF 19.5.1) TaxID=521045 RepID=C5CFG5_KOSOT|nr:MULTISPECIES: hypothetical protein [Kosmotoga]ACR80373.1 hypothetical protein Kole_1684 [Kosmotoga olearia TBF 19.5.1]MDI3523806.1 hypothetical protein [Kosmotoga sp.]MDK2953350.1 hypothetical protein [Kosmotoga sp.]
MKKYYLIILLGLLSVTGFSFDPFLVQTGGNSILATGYWANYGSPSDLYGILNSAVSTQVLEYRRAGSETVERELHILFFDPSEGGMAGILEWVMDAGLVNDYRSISYTVSGPLSPTTNYGVKLKLDVEDITTPGLDTYWLMASAGITGATGDFVQYVAAFNNALIWTSLSNSTAEKLDLFVGFRIVTLPFRLGIEFGTRAGMNVRYAGISLDLKLFDALALRGGVSYNVDLNWTNSDVVVGGGFQLTAGNMGLSLGVGANLNNTITDQNIDIEFMWGATFFGRW